MGTVYKFRVKNYYDVYLLIDTLPKIDYINIIFSPTSDNIVVVLSIVDFDLHEIRNVMRKMKNGYVMLDSIEPMFKPDVLYANLEYLDLVKEVLEVTKYVPINTSRKGENVNKLRLSTYLLRICDSYERPVIFEDMGRSLNRSHCNIMYHYKEFLNRLEIDTAFQLQYKSIIAQFKEKGLRI
jgi:hypothetical protein